MSVCSTLKFAVPVAVAALAAGSLSAQEGQPGPVGGARLIVRAIANGDAVADLKAEDLALRVNGKTLEVGALQLVSAASAPAAAAAPAAAPKPSNLPPPFQSNKASAETASPGGREFLFVVDEDGIAPGQEAPVKRLIGKVIAEARETDRFGYMSLRLGGPNIPPSTGRGPVTDVLAKLVAAGSSSETSVDLTCRTKRSMGMITSAFDAAPAGRTLVLISPGMAATPPEVKSIRSNVDGQGNFSGGLPQTCEIRSSDLESFGVAAAMSPANMYVVYYAQGLASPQNLSVAQAGIENLAGVTGAEMIRIQNGDEASISRLVKETSAYYIATVAGIPPGPMRRIEARTKREGVRVAAHPTSAGGAVVSEVARGGGKASPRDMIRVPTVYRDLPVRAAAFLSRQPNSNDVKVMMLFEPEDPEVKLAAATIVFFDEKGSGKAQWNSQSADLQRAPVLAASVVPPGTYRVRVAATDAQGRGGTTDINLVARLPEASTIKLSDLILGTDPKSPKLQFAATDKQVIGFVSVYGAAKDMNVSVSYEIRESESSAPLGSMPGNPLPVQGAQDEQMFWGGFGLDPLAPGDYLMRAVVSVNGKEVGAASRTLRKVK